MTSALSDTHVRIITGLEALAIQPAAGAAEALARHLALAVAWNRAYNLTAVRDPVEMIARHVLDSAVALPFLRGRRMLDAGSGAGFPGIVLALLAPDTNWILVEANGKKARFLRHALRQLDLFERVSVAQERLENYHPEATFDTITARALADLATLARWAAPCLLPGGVCWRSRAGASRSKPSGGPWGPVGTSKYQRLKCRAWRPSGISWLWSGHDADHCGDESEGRGGENHHGRQPRRLACRDAPPRAPD